MAAFGDLAQWLSLRGARGGQPDRHAQLPKGDGPLILMVGEAPGLAQALPYQEPTPAG